MARDKIYKADNARFMIDGMDLDSVASQDRDAEMKKLLDLLDEFYLHGVVPKCEDGMMAHVYAFGDWPSFIFSPFENVGKWNISNKTYQRMSSSLMANPGIFRNISDVDWTQKRGFKNDCGFSSIETGVHYSGDVDTWHKNREAYFRANQQDIDWDGRDDPDLSFLPNRHRSDLLLQQLIDKFVADSVDEEARKNNWTEEEYKKNYTRRYNEIAEKLDKNVGVTFHSKVMNDKDGSLEALADEVGTEICETNFYVYEDKLTRDERRKASGSLRKIFSIINKNGEKQYISIDFKHGMFEFLDKNGDHLGEYRFNGMFNSDPQPSHNFKTLRS
ncbi:MAG: hypothetical protein K2H72_08240 [Muribaculaceae bacterium]|nr:hypothetical protein [Muribaculaceae bacterium]